MEAKFGCCGLDCGQCPIYIATTNKDEVLREKTAKEWLVRYAEYLPKDMELKDFKCEGCNSKNGYIGCTTCPIRKCVTTKNYLTCASCDEYFGCDMLNGFFSQHNQAKQNLESLRK